MAGPGTATSQPLQVDTSSLVGRGADPNIVSPAATTALTDAFHRGFITADDIQERLSQRTKEKQALDLEQTQAARKNVGITQKADEETKKAAILDAQLKPGDYGLMNKALSLEGFSVRTNPEGVTDEDRTEIGKRYGALLELKRRQTESASRVKDTEIKPVDVLTKDAAGNEVKGQVIRRLFQGKEISPKQFDSWAQEDAVLRHTSLPQFYQLFSTQGKTVSNPVVATPPAAPVAAPAPAPAALPTPEAIAAANAAPITPEQRAAMVNSGVPVTQAAMATGLVQPPRPTQPAQIVQPAQPTSPISPAIGTTTPEGMFVTGVTEAKTSPAAAKQIGALQERLNTLSNTEDTILKARALAVPGIVGPGQIGLVQKAHQAGAALGRESDKKAYTAQSELNTIIANEIANYVQDWKGAISDKELVFFKNARPRIDSTPEQWTSYLDEWAGKTERLKKVVAGELPPADAAEWAKNPRSQSPATGAEAGGPTTSAPEQTVSSGGKTYVVRVDPNTGQKRYFVRQ